MKQKNALWLLLSFLLLVLIGCESSDSNCVTNAGKVVKEVRELDDFDSIDVEEYVNLILTQDSVNKVTVETGNNILDGIVTEVNNGQLYIKNNNKCNWLRSYNIPVNVYISVKNLKKIYYNSSGNVTTTNTIRSNFFKFEVWGGCGSIDMDLDIYEGYFVLQMGTVDFTLRGYCAINTIYAGDYGFFQCKDLTTGYTFITNQGSNDCYVRASQYLQATVNSIGNIYYSGNPDTLITKINGQGNIYPY
jgi:hypothetical protein